jgi:hypothetical protein
MRLDYGYTIEIVEPAGGRELTPAEQKRLHAAMNRAIERAIEETICGGRKPPAAGVVSLDTIRPRPVRGFLGVINFDAAVS